MGDICRLLWCALVGLFRSRASLEAEILLLRHQLNVLRQRSPKRVVLTDVDRLLFAGLYHLAPGVLKALKIVKPETVIRWHRAGFRAYWRRKAASPTTITVPFLTRFTGIPPVLMADDSSLQHQNSGVAYSPGVPCSLLMSTWGRNQLRCLGN